MTFADRIELLRKRNRDLMKRLKQQGEQLMRLHGCSPSGGAEREDGEKDWRDPAEDPSVSGGQGGEPAESDLAKPARRPGDSSEEHAGAQLASPTTLKWECGQQPVGPAAAPLGGSTGPSQVQERRSPSTETHRVTHSAEQASLDKERKPASASSDSDNLQLCKDVVSRDSSRLLESDRTSDRRRSRPLLGYDWIAGILDVDDSLTERSDKFFHDLQTFRSRNKDKCVYIPPTDLNPTCDGGPPMLGNSGSPGAEGDAHQCLFQYLMNDRFFLIPRHSEERCAVCRIPKACHPHTECNPALVRVSIPCSVILPAYKYKAHRRCSFDPSDGLDLPSHCLSGWTNRGPQQPHSSLDLQSNMTSATGSHSNEVAIAAAPKEVAQVSEVSRLPPFNFQHFSPRRRRPRTFQSSL